MGLLILSLPVLLLLKKLVPRGECILAKVGKVGWNIVLCNNNLGLLAQEIVQEGKTKIMIKILCILQEKFNCHDNFLGLIL